MVLVIVAITLLVILAFKVSLKKLPDSGCCSVHDANQKVGNKGL